jgi:hypothetical protein
MTRRPSPRRGFRLPGLLAVAAALLLSARPAPAQPEEGGPAEDLLARVVRQMEKVLELMRENEAALLAVSTRGGEAPRPVEVKPPEGDGRPSGAAPTAEDPAARAEAIRRRMDELLRGQEGTARRIPAELEELVRMIPLCSGNCESDAAQEPGAGRESPSGQDAEQEARDARRPEQPDRPEGDAPEARPEQGRKEPNDPASRGESAPEDPAAGGTTPRGSELPPWAPLLPPEIRDSWSRGEFERIPPAYREIIERYTRRLRELK